MEKNMKQNYTFDDLMEITRRLVGPDGCAWDRAQTHESLRRFAVEEAYELVDAIESADVKKIADESGDVLFQVVLHAALSERDGGYHIEDVTDAICKKMIRRHPSVFGLDGPEDWDAIKRLEKNQQGLLDELAEIPKGFPALLQAEKVQKKIAKAGYEINKSLPKDANEELQLGKELFDLADKCRRAGIAPELALNHYLKEYGKNFEEDYKGE